jgi:glucose/arabinose dehydrogenase
MLLRYAAVACLLLLNSVPARAQLRKVTYVSGLTQPVAFVQDPSDSSVQYVPQQGGVVRVIKNGSLQATPFLDLHTAIATGGERGLLGIAFPSDYAASGRLYVDFTNPSGDIVVARFKRSTGNPLVADPASRFDIQWSTGARFISHQAASNHNGGTLQFGPDGYLYVAVGDGGATPTNAQSMSSLLGKLLRIDVSVPDANPAGRAIPPDNPFPSGAAPEIWDVGLRNPWKFSFDDPARGGTGALVVADVGQSSFEEFNFEPAGRGGQNYGWPIREGAHDFSPSVTPAFLPLVDPTFEYPRSTGSSITGGYVYRGTTLGTSFRGRYFFADFVAARIFSMALTIDPNTGRATASDFRNHTAELTPGNVSSFGVDAAGELFFVDYSNGAIVRIAAMPGLMAPVMAVDPPARNQTVTQPFAIAGWALDPLSASGAGIDAIHVWAYPLPALGAAPNGPPVFVGATTTTFDRPDVAAAFGSTQFTRSGFGLIASGLTPGFYSLAVFGLVQSTGRFDVVRVVDVNIVAHTFIAVGPPFPGPVGSTMGVGGWALDAAAPAGTGVDAIHVWATPAAGGSFIFLGATTTFGDRADVGAVFGARFIPSGFTFGVNSPPPGVWDVYVYAHSTATGLFTPSGPIRVTR